MNEHDKAPRTAVEETEEEVREALTHVEEDDEHTGEAGDALRPDRDAQEQAYGEPDE
ncbi:hypothetical protein MMF93_02130 [Streptomyces tubbatahanensis]|uniref:DUF5709 domain-containing protein n=1 Tax=Streptomyces tubbatahanensis TaxID=2923272 RepID=A0ABY3XLU6_9ACTN|nr:hypothetical protein [Streptomyces tubbatahanensis]UNS95398.1 hypothetical protein MMF93_02130 [Streptomyces tubbatahanensis]